MGPLARDGQEDGRGRQHSPEPGRPGARHRPARGRSRCDAEPEQRIARLEAENAALRAETTKLTTEREILRQAAKYFAGETNW